ncbi:uncharacterized protein L3040_002207 [Drepanopeziza brunnea f. sp. 'multigermtubi']|uniref:ATP synthase subunit K n=1 Tax=Marssonina brunnea f. sp. multigermtubi (strain MB_m1) TaxID=1072389 RepID=K1X4W3_MARBU|nr:uncharacterized protein MBM_02069 [Drepanopeziza brunnea f. sp. 'multigermtubi' MB_m1]EKD20117.1 hypothetical protein MBM_02069 [Drepanopeziza brunnea f. sp. 'multigermtubi' MB_m1]KAJ5050324.1 hypothetical protein L3040_002207 [Drepanopeziza brunnea f. sp. 'multigermtubi']
MVQMYTIAGKQVGSHVLAMITLGVLSSGAYFSMGGSSAKKVAGATPPLNAKSPAEESFITDFLKNAEADAKKGSKPAQ